MKLPSFRKPTPTAVEYARLLKKLSEMDPDSPEYARLMEFLERLDKIEAPQRRTRISRDTMLIVLANLAGILIIVAYEREHVITSKGFTQLMRPKS